MKGLIGVLLLLSILGCNDLSITDPIAAKPSPDPELSLLRAQSYLVLRAVLREPGNVNNSLVEVNGGAAYLAPVFELDPIPPAPQYAVRLILTVSADLRPYEIGIPDPPAAWRVSGTSDDMVSIPDSGTALLTKRYRVEGRSDGVILNVRFRITVASVEVDEMWLEPGQVPDSTH